MSATVRRPVHLAGLVLACFLGLLAVTWGGGAVAAWAGQVGKAKARARVLDVGGTRSSGHVTVEFTTRQGRVVRAEEHRRGWPRTVKRGRTIEVVYATDDPAGSVAPFQDVVRSLPVVALFAAGAALSGVVAYRTRRTKA
ncbi:DUF3592 domain-containing protein [Actinomadura sp. B10D3]|uniref:DUF3592 domain-containing protein n=1 Tax=Actinomadura sp. B10D3 TaxID=3153557 RepID=UPI00325CF682